MIPKPYFGGTKVSAGVKRLAADNFKAFVENYIYVPVQFPMTRPEFMALPTKEKDRLKDGPYVVASSYNYDDGPRNDADATKMVLAILDLDEGPFIRDFFESPEAFQEHLYPYNFVAYTTAKHTPENPRIKVIVDVEPSDPLHHHRFVNFVIDRLAIPRNFKGTIESHTLSLPAFRPLQFKGSEYDAVIASRLEGIPVSLTDLPEATEEETARIFRCTDMGDIELSLAHLPVHGLTVDDVREPLFALSPDMPYHPWVQVAMSLRHQFSHDEELAHAAYQLYDEWSATGTKYHGSDETYRKWKSAKPYAKFRAPRTVKSLFFEAMAAGWENTKLSKKLGQSVSDWIIECDQGDLLSNEGPRRIASMPFKNDVTEEMLIDLLVERIYSVTKRRVTKATIKGQVMKERKADRTEGVRKENPSWILPFCFVGPENIFKNVATGDTYIPAAFDNTFGRYLTPEPDPNSNEPAPCKPLVPPSQKALNEVKIPIVDGCVYDPRHAGEEPYLTLDGRRMLNTYLRTSIPEPEDEYGEVAGRLFNALLSAVVGNPEYERHIRDYFAFIVQFPGVKIRWAPFIQGVQGGGKGTLAECLQAAVGTANFKLVTADGVQSTFTEWREGSQVVYLDEIKSPGHNRHEIMNRLKDCITNDRIMVAQKFKDVRTIYNVTNYILSTNNRDALVLEEGDRRYLIIISDIQCRAQVLALNATGIFDKIHRLLSRHPGAFRAYFLSHKISEDFPVNGPAPETEYRAELIEDSKNQLQIAIEALIEDDRYPLIGDDVIDFDDLNERTRFEQQKQGRVAKYLRDLGYKEHGVFEHLAGKRRTLWVHRDHMEDLVPAAELIRIRVSMMPDEDVIG